ncbi:MBL fold metallo-hydrolase [Paracoccus sp. SM22M-07]|uniref:MBL fold metallo-hydrolase n=1 Tax=Paracoccus sp. SM22M-07 TaxID=1520813 RepID=UPI0009315A54|nr:MBL fold metallo-hydrolase [Paracoccus sp. SM22M-07]
MIPPRLHATLDALSAALLVVGPSVAGARPSARKRLAAIGLGVAAYSLATSYRDPAPERPIRPELHRLLDAGHGATCLALAQDVDEPSARALLRGYAAFALAVAALSSPAGPRGIQVEAQAAAVPGDELASLRCGIVNVAFIGAPGSGDREWFLVDAGIPGSAKPILRAARRRYGQARPAAILLTHGHFDHVGAIRQLMDEWDAPVYAHPAEHPYLTGRLSYPPAAPEVGGGMMAELSSLFPRHAIDISRRLRALPDGGHVPGLTDWQWIHTPGHTPGHVSFWNRKNGALIAGDAIITTKQESLHGALFPRARLQGPPAYFTPDWSAAQSSIRRLADLDPNVLVTGHGPTLQGAELTRGLRDLLTAFQQRAMPRNSRYLQGPRRTGA